MADQTQWNRSYPSEEPFDGENPKESGVTYDDDGVGPFASSIYNPHSHGEMVQNLSDTSYYHISNAAQPSARRSPQHTSAMNENTLNWAGFTPTTGLEQPDEMQIRDWPSAAFEPPSFSFDPALVNTLVGSSPANGGGDIDLANFGQSPASPNGTPQWQHLTTQQGSQRPWSPLHMSHGNVQPNPMPDYRSSVSSVGPQSSQGVPSSASITRATGTSATSEYYDDTVLADSVLTERPPLFSPGLSPGIGNNTLFPIAQPDRRHLARQPNSTSSSVQRYSQRGGDSARRRQQQAAINANHVQSDSPTLTCEYLGCSQEFRGTHRRGTMHRHMRLKHGGQVTGPEKSFPCEVAGCRKTFKRQDARLKHYRSKHLELGVAAATPRKDKQS